MKIKRYFLLFLSLLLLVGCEFESDKVNFQEIEKPSDNIDISVNLNNVEPGSTIICFNSYQCFNLQVDTKGKKIIQAKAKYGSWEQEFHIGTDGRGEFCISNYQGDYEDYVVLQIAVSSGTNSLADMMGLEGYYGEIEYKLKFVSDIGKLLNIKHRKNDDGFLEVYWNDLKEVGIDVKEYKINYYNNKEGYKTIQTSETHFVDESFCMGCRSYNFEITINGSQTNPQYVSYEMAEYYTSEVSLQQKDGYVHLSWEKPKYPCKYIVLYYNNYKEYQSPLLDYDETSYSIPTGFVDSKIYGGVYFVPSNYENESIYNYTQIEFNYYTSNNSIGVFGSLIYNQKENVVYTYYSDIRSISLDNLQLVSTRQESEHIYLMASSPVSSKSAFVSNERIFVFPDKSLTGSFVIQRKDVEKRNVLITGKDHLILRCRQYGYNNNNEYHEDHYIEVHDLTSKKLLYTFPVNEPTYHDIMVATNDGNHLAIASKDGIIIYELGDDNATTIYQDDGYYLAASSIPSQPGNILFKEGDYYTIRQISDFSLIKKSNVYPHFTTGNVDPVTNTLLCYINNNSDDQCLVLDINTLEEIYHYTNNFRLNNLYLYNGILICGSGNYMDINKELKQ